ncbi:hypothetical protein RHGRI_002896 [Rhododendron griersonianum]|uniref:Phospholipase A1 n=1 Tax=Rhododendron griersonianum TaxID=479676 RepID=A0AAV6LS11_9ERIC|nr:hypothetical protein RHGRI_002896 [Rhododendron griersonianum]
MHYLHATANVNLPGFLKKSVRLRSENAYWIGYVAVSDNEKSTVLGRLDITITWRGTKTRLELVEDFKDLLRPIRPTTRSCQDRIGVPGSIYGKKRGVPFL